MLQPVLITAAAPADPVVTRSEAKAHLIVEHTEHDDLIDGLVAAAVARVDGFNGLLTRCLVTQTWEQSFSAFGDCMLLPLGPVQSISSVKYFDATNVEQTLASSVYAMHTGKSGSFLTLAPDQTWPAIYSRIDAVAVEFIAGYGDASAVPQDIKHAILMMVGHWYRNRDAVGPGGKTSEVPLGAKALLENYRRISV